MLRNDHFGDALGFDLLRKVVLVAVDEHHNIGILLNRTGFTEVAQTGSLVLTGFDSTVQLGQRDDRNMELSRKALKRPRDHGDLLLTVLLARPVHQLEVVDHDQVKAWLAAKTPALRPDLGNSETRRVIDEDVLLVQSTCGIRQLGEVALFQVAGAEFLRIDTALRAQHPGHDFLPTHLE